jgi:hypothetical protein
MSAISLSLLTLLACGPKGFGDTADPNHSEEPDPEADTDTDTDSDTDSDSDADADSDTDADADADADSDADVDDELCGVDDLIWAVEVRDGDGVSCESCPEEALTYVASVTNPCGAEVIWLSITSSDWCLVFDWDLTRHSGSGPTFIAASECGVSSDEYEWSLAAGETLTSEVSHSPSAGSYTLEVEFNDLYSHTASVDFSVGK